MLYSCWVEDNLLVCVCETCAELSTMTSCPAVPAVTAYEQMSVFPCLKMHSRGTLSTDLTYARTFSACNRLLLKLLLAVESRAPSEVTLIYLCLSAAALVHMLKKPTKIC